MPATNVKSSWSTGTLVFSRGNGWADGKGISFGIDGSGLDIKFFGDTASAYMLWDQSADALVIAGAAKITMGVATTLVIPVKASGSTVAGDLWLDTTDSKLHFYNGSGEKTVTDS